ncbi:hypothetical protein LY01_00266 [Nonlabens xylanidelens]|uniref:Uncharacterized protein n=1 Tax=Nonlabens xylanidelens TaxID=191564 RepID=A0A2S6IQR0_9FLAO|nr:hypothetical protein [Nonlabens xylanidelens]PPK96446.1 hypothetical protein LY01_00266 [Nonlabens xylanidelens]
MMKYIFILILLANLNSCQSQETSAYEDRVYQFLNEVYKPKKSSNTSKVGYIDNMNNLDNSIENISDDLLKTVLSRAKQYYRFHIPDSVLNYKNWKELKVHTLTKKFDQNKIVIPNLQFIDSKEDHDGIIMFHIEGILFYGNFAFIATNHGGTIPIGTLFKKEGEKYDFVTMTSYPPLGDE